MKRHRDPAPRNRTGAASSPRILTHTTDVAALIPEINGFLTSNNALKPHNAAIHVWFCPPIAVTRIGTGFHTYIHSALRIESPSMACRANPFQAAIATSSQSIEKSTMAFGLSQSDTGMAQRYGNNGP